MPKPNGPQFQPIILKNQFGRERTFKALYHGTVNPIPENENIIPASHRHPEGIGRKTAVATPSLSVAKRFAGHPEGYVYRVEPLDRDDMNSTWYQPIRYWRKGAIEVPSNKGFRIIEQIHPKS